MEWCHQLDRAIPEDRLAALCTLERLPGLCQDIYEVSAPSGPDQAEISCVWGVFETRRSRIRNGIRYELLSCPNALQWTVTTRHGATTLHGSINQLAPDQDFADSIGAFLDSFRQGLLAADSSGR